MCKKITYEYVENFAESKGYKLLSTTYKNAKEKLDFICSNGHSYSTTWNSFQRGVRCSECSGNKRITIDLVKDKISSLSGYKLVTEKSKLGKLNERFKFDISCEKGHVYSTCWADLKRGCKCPYCAGKYKNIKNIEDFIRNENLGYELISNEYFNSSEKIELRCGNGHIFKASWDSIKSGRGCGKCKGNKISESKVTPEEDLIDYFDNNGYRFIKWLDNYSGQKTYCELTCPCGHSYITYFDSFKKRIKMSRMLPYKL